MNAVLEPPPPAPEAPAPEAEENKLYCAEGWYYRRENDGCYGQLGRADAVLHYQALGFKKTGTPISPAEQALYNVQRNNRVDYAGPLCGRGVGLTEENGARILVTRPPRFIEGTPGESPTIDKVLNSVFGAGAGTGDPDAHLSVATFLAWLKHAREAMRHPERDLRGLVLGIIGPPGCGKSLIQDFIVTPGLGGRCADPAAWLTGKSDFNGECWQAEHLVLSDKTLDGTGPQRDALKNRLKELVANAHHRLHRKGIDGITARPIWRTTLTANDDAESATVIPTLDGGFADKVAYLYAHPPAAPFFDEQVPGEREAFAARLKTELPCFLHAVDRYDVPAEVVGHRFGVAAWHHPAVVALLESPASAPARARCPPPSPHSKLRFAPLNPPLSTPISTAPPVYRFA
jgi:hypothetical protein